MNSQILIVEDELITQRMIAVNLERAGHQVCCAGSVAEAELAISQRLPDLILLDWMLPNATGLSLARRLHSDQRTREIPIIMLSSRSHESDKISGLDSGVDDYMTKPFSPRELLARVNAQLRRRAPQTTDDVVELAGLTIYPALKRVSAGGCTFSPGIIEFRMLHFFATHAGRVYSREQLLDKLWGDQVYVQDRTVDAHIRALRQALRPSGHDVLIETVRGVGYCFRREAPQPPAPVASSAQSGATAGNARPQQMDIFVAARPESEIAKALS
jgi:two-component system phosphate regulon response regulator PhoB